MVTELSPFLCGKYELLSYWKSFMKYVCMDKNNKITATRFKDFIPMLKDMLCPGLRGMTLGMMRDLASADILATV